MANEYFKAVKHTEQLAEQTRNAAHTQTQLLRQQAQSAKSAAFTSGVNAAANILQVAQQQRILAEQRRAAQQQAEGLALQYREHEEARTHRFAMWRQTPDGVAYTAWQADAETLAAILDDRDSRWRASWRTAVTRLRAEASPEDVELVRAQHRLSVSPSVRHRMAQVWRVLSIVGAFITTLSLLATGLSWAQVGIGSIGGFGAPVGPAVTKTVTTLIFAAFAVFALIRYRRGKDLSHLVTASRVTGERALEQNRRAQLRVNQYGFDPLTVADGFTWYWWYPDTGFHGYAAALRTYMQEAVTAFPTAASLPALRIPEAIAPERATLPEQAAVLHQFVNEQASLTSR